MNLIAVLLAIVIMPVAAPHIDWDALTLDQQMALIDVWRPDPPERVQVFLPSFSTLPPAPVGPLPPVEVEGLIRTYFQPEDVDLAIQICWCESRFDASARNPTSTASGLFQVMKGWWSGEWSSYPPFDPYDPNENTKFSAWLFYNSGVQNWNASKGCWG